MNSKLKATAILAGVFLLGAVAGAFGGQTMAFRHLHSVTEGSPSEQRLHFRLETMRHELDLDEDRAKKVEGILRTADPERDHAITPCKAGLDELRTRTDAQIVEVLRPDQRSRYEEMAKRRAAGRRP